MNKRIFIVTYAILLLVHLIGIQSNVEWLTQATKPLLIPFLVVYFLSQANRQYGPLKKWIVLALFFSWVGDVLLMFQSRAAA